MHTHGVWKDLAILGGRPVFDEPLHVNRPNAVDRDPLFRRIDELLERRWLSNGQLVREFETEIGRIAGTSHCIATCNGTLAIEVAVTGLDLTGEVIVPSFTYIATVQALRRLGITPVYCDVDEATHNIDPEHAEELISPRTSAILGVHLWGNACDIDRLQEVAERRGVRLLFDAAHALGSTYGGRPIGGFGSAETFSFHATKFVSTAEGGAVTTDDDELATRLRSARNLGLDETSRIAGFGTNAKMSELCAAMGLTQLEQFEALIAANEATVEAYRSRLDGVVGIDVFEAESHGRTNSQYVVTIVDELLTGISRDDILRSLEAENILAKRYFHPGCHRMDPHNTDTHDGPGTSLPVTDRLARTVLVLPGGASIGREEIDGVCRTLRLIVDQGPEIRSSLRGELHDEAVS